MRMPALILTVMAATLLMSPASPQAKVNLSRKDQTEESAKKVKELQKERIETLEQMAIATGELFKKGLVKYEEVFEAKLLVLEAAVDAAEKESDRIKFYKKLVDEMKKYEEFADDKLKSGRSSMATFLKVKARRLEAEINLERAKAKGNRSAG